MFTIEGGTEQSRCIVNKWAVALFRIMPLLNMSIRIRLDSEHVLNHNITLKDSKPAEVNGVKGIMVTEIESRVPACFSPFTNELFLDFNDPKALQFMCHEWVHAHQMDRGDLSANPAIPNITFWKKQAYIDINPMEEVEKVQKAFAEGRITIEQLSERIDKANRAYYEQPWEKEAHGNEERLSKQVLELM
jgi:hypothetical protein